ncbi:MAG: aspartate/glutamate racemase family protein [Collimonas pratensis]|uniref:aspartate/glutamate racemase family protein n=1 Tax=Collimonas pratensis TaxID=279113 RepID=UPI003C73D1D6
MATKPLIGILAGMGPRSTAPFIDLVVTECQLQYGAKDDCDFPGMMIYSLPAPFYADRPIDHAVMEETLHAGLRGLERAGVDFMAIACNTAHVYYPQLARDARQPLLNMVALTVDALAGTTHQVAVIGARPTIEAAIYQEGIARRGFSYVDPGWQPAVDTLIEALHEPLGPAALKARWNDLEEQAKAAGADTIIVACADLSAASVGLQGVVVDATRCLAHEIVAEWLRRQRA